MYLTAFQANTGNAILKYKLYTNKQIIQALNTNTNANNHFSAIANNKTYINTFDLIPGCVWSITSVLNMG